MNKTLKYALGAVLTAGLIVPAMAQDNFPDVPDNHWAYEALARMKKDGLLVGYPDGLFRGNRPASRYELAVAVHATYTHLKNITDGLQTQIDELKNRPAGGYNDSALREAITQLQNDVRSMKGWGDDIANLKRMADTFQKELASMGVDIEALKKDLADLAKRVGVLEARKPAVDVHGDLNLFMMSGASQDSRAGVTVDGRPLGVNDRAGIVPNTYILSGFTHDVSMFHEAAIKLTGTNETGPKWQATMVMNNMLGVAQDNVQGGVLGGTGQSYVAGHTGTPFPGMGSTTPLSPIKEGPTNFFLYDAFVHFDTSIIGQGFTADLGRTGYSVSPYLFQRPDATPYFQNDRWDNGKWIFDGGIVGFKWGGVGLNVFAGRQSSPMTSTGLQLNPMTAGMVGHRFQPGAIGGNTSSGRPAGLPNNNPQNGSVYGVPVDQHLGLHLGVPLGQNGKLDLAYIWLESNTGVTSSGRPSVSDDPFSGGLNGPSVADSAQVFGGDLRWNFGNIVLDGGYAQSNLRNNDHDVVTKDNFAWHAALGYDASRWGARIGYREIRPQFGAPGDWGRIGLWWNPTDIKGPEARVHFNITDRLKLSASGEWYTGTERTITNPVGAAWGGLSGTTTTGLSQDDKINRYTAELGFRLNDAWNLSVGAEWIDWDLESRAANASHSQGAFAGGRPRERWYNVGLGYNLSDMARLNFLWQFSDYHPGTGAGTTSPVSGFAFPSRDGKATGHLLTTQLSVKF